MALSHPYQTGGFHAPVVRIVRYGVRPGVARRHFVHLVASIIEQPSLLLCAIAARQPISRYTERNFTQAQRIIRSARLTRETVYYLFPRRFLAAPSDEPPPCLRIGGIPVIRCQPVWMLSTGAASSACFNPHWTTRNARTTI